MKNIKLNVLGEQRLSEREMNELVGGCSSKSKSKVTVVTAPAACSMNGPTDDTASNAAAGVVGKNCSKQKHYYHHNHKPSCSKTKKVGNCRNQNHQ